MRRLPIVISMLALAAAACLCTGSPAPTLEPVSQEPTESQTATQQPQGSVDVPTSGSLSTAQIAEITKAAVQVVAAQPRSGGIEPLWGGSGTIVSPTGKIITNCHVACGAPILIILMTDNPDQPPVEMYIAEVTQAREDLDLAVLQITTSGSPVNIGGGGDLGRDDIQQNLQSDHRILQIDLPVSIDVAAGDQCEQVPKTTLKRVGFRSQNSRWCRLSERAGCLIAG